MVLPYFHSRGIFFLFAAEGEGRNAVYAAQHGFEVSAFDSSLEGKNKAEALAEEKNVAISYIVSGLEDVDFGTSAEFSNS